MIKSNIVWLQIPTEIIRNINYTVDDKSFTVYAFLLYVKFRSRNNKISIDHNMLKLRCNISDNRTLRKCVECLYNNGLIKDKVEKFPIKSELKLELLEPYDNKWFTQLPIDIFYKLDEIGYSGFRLLFYYESFINRKILTKDFCFSSFETIKSDLKISNDTLIKYNDILSKLKYITITRHEVMIDEFLDSSRFTKYNNHYKVNIQNLIRKKE